MPKQEAYRKLIRILGYLEKIDANDYYSISSTKAIESFKKFILFFIENFENLSPNSYSTLNISLAKDIIPYIRYIERSQTENIPWSIIHSLEQLLQTIRGDKYFFLLRPQWNFNYSVIQFDINSYLSKYLISFFPS